MQLQGYPSGRIIDYDRSGCTCSVAGVTTTFSGTTTTLVANLSYRPFGAADGMTVGSGTVANVHDEAGRLLVANPGAPMERTYTYDNLGNLLTVDAPGETVYNRTYTYDDLYRLTSAVFPWETISYSYDDNGNRLTRTIDAATETYAYVPDTNRLDNVSAANTVFYATDAAGKITGIDDRTLVYNDNDRLVRVEEDGTVLGEYVYNGLGQRMKKTVDGVDTVFHWDLNDNVIAESSAAGTFTKEYLYRNSGRLAMVDVATGTFYFYLNDNLGTPQMLTDAAGMVVWEGLYRPFGETNVNPNSTVENNFRFAGQYYDAETGYHYNYHRYYDPCSGRYLSPDPIGLAAGINLFSYAALNPINSIDPLGLYNLWDLTEDSLSFAAGLGNAISFGGTTLIAKQFMNTEESSILSNTEHCSFAFKVGEWASLSIGVGRLAYAALAKGSSVIYAAKGATMKNAAAASAFRNILKKVFSLNPMRKSRIYSFEKIVETYGTAEKIIEASGRTSKYYNQIGAFVTSSSTSALLTNGN